MSMQESSFVTLGQRVLARPLKLVTFPHFFLHQGVFVLYILKLNGWNSNLYSLVHMCTEKKEEDLQLSRSSYLLCYDLNFPFLTTCMSAGYGCTMGILMFLIESFILLGVASAKHLVSSISVKIYLRVYVIITSCLSILRRLCLHTLSGFKFPKVCNCFISLDMWSSFPSYLLQQALFHLKPLWFCVD